MPRRPKPPRDLIVHGLSAGAKSFAEVQATYVDDWGEVQPMRAEALAELVTDYPKVIIDYRKRMRAVRLAREYLEAKRYTDQRDNAHKLLFAKREQTLAHNQCKLTDSLVITVRKPNAKWRRL